MRRPRFPIAELLIVILIITIDCAALRVALRSDEPQWILMGLGAAPMGTLLAIGLLIQAHQVRCRGWVSPALIGFKVLGGLALLNFTASSLVLPEASPKAPIPLWIVSPGSWGSEGWGLPRRFDHRIHSHDSSAPSPATALRRVRCLVPWSLPDRAPISI